ncbi:FKBP-type peptidyl-prolyl cis-trans isomerase [Solimicrobium silvestre]|uniref:Peptidyl-prolyl cis-trans isomerase n=1 Tax=Solimicrobium silvestre TaxID=2099400 RepID=A0A2S9H1H8_9BURK|nr:FKBP-type peptidyl-prolyl cis-trans isomerase [Solimicrobium silvestre]PRC93817.1 FKBP-type peptidyl-prolyl cis-trans isomerases 1 [Solimicrobium silvestre]
MNHAQQLRAMIVVLTLSVCAFQHNAIAKQQETTTPVNQASEQSVEPTVAPEPVPALAPTPAPAPAPVPTPALVIKDTKIGKGAEAVAGQDVTVHYTGWLYDAKAKKFHGKKFDSSRDHGQPFKFPLGGHRVIQGWDQGVVGMKIGGKRTLIIPSELAYGTRGAGDVIPPGAKLVFDVELLAVK